MKLEIAQVSNQSDRIATADEVRAAVPVLDQFSDSRLETICEIPADTGGYIRISEEDLAAVAAREIDPAWMDYVEYWSPTVM